MTARLRAAALSVVAMTVAFGLTACGTPALTGTPGKDIAKLPASTMPKELNGLAVKQEDISKSLKQAKHAYVDAVGFWTFRQARVVQGTVQVSRFGPSARLEDPDFRKQIITQTSPGEPTDLNVGGASVAQSQGSKSTVSIWISKGRLIVLTALLSYTGSRGLLEAALDALPADPR